MPSFAVRSAVATLQSGRWFTPGFTEESALSELSAGTPPSASASEDRLDSWKEIAAYLNRDVTTVQRWEKREGMPVRRHLHDRMGSVYASRAELDSWARGRNLRVAQKNVNPVLSPDPPAPVPHVATPTSHTKGKVIYLMAAGVGLVLAIGVIVWLQKRDYFWRSPIAAARIQTVTNFDGMEQEAAVSRDGQFVAFLSDRDGPMDVWVTQVGSGEFHNLTRGSTPEMANPAVRTLGFSPDVHSSPFGFVSQTVQTATVSTSGPCRRWAGRRDRTLRVRRSSTGRATPRVWFTTRRGPGTRCLCRTDEGYRRGSLSSLRLRGCMPIFLFGHQICPAFTSCKVLCRINWISGAYLPVAELRNGSLLTTLV